MSQREPVIGIDLGTTFSVPATVENGHAHVIPTRAGGRLTPSMIGFTPSGERVVGEKARQVMEQHPEQVAYATKRFIGRRWSRELVANSRQIVPYSLVPGPSGEVRVNIAGRVLPVPQVSAMILGELKLDCDAYFGRPVSKAVITVPANFDDGQRQATKEAASIAGLEVLRIVNEPTAAAVAYGLTEKFTGRALVFDLGGGTFDVSILEVENGVFQVKATGGDPLLGGEDWDNRIVQWLIAQVPEAMRDTVAKDMVSVQRLKMAAEKAKCELSTNEEAYLAISELGDHLGARKFIELNTALTRTFFETLSEPLCQRCLKVCEQVMTDAKLAPSAVDSVLLVGGMTRVPMVRRLVEGYFSKQPVMNVNPDEVVALGAAIHAQEIADRGGSALLIDVASHSLGVAMLGGKVRRLVSKNTSIPVVARDTFVPGRHGQTEARISVYQGESEYVDEDKKLGDIVLKDLKVNDRSETPIDVSFELSSEGTLTVRATDLSTGLAQAIRIESRTELSESEVTKLTKDQGQYNAVRAKADVDAAFENFKRLLDRGDKLARVLQKGAQENPSEEATAAVASVRSLLDLGKAALRSRNTEQIAEISRRLERLAPTATK